MNGRFVGRSTERQRIDQILCARESLWITGPAGIGKSRLVLEAIGARRAVVLDGHLMATPAEALRYLGELFGTSPDTDRPEAIAVWLASSLAALANQLDVLVVEDLHATARATATMLLRIFRRAALGYPALAIGRESWRTSELVGDHLHHLRLHELGELDTEDFAQGYARRSEDLPPAALGHPLLMDLFFRDGSSSTDEWTDALLGELAGHRALLMRLVVAHSPIQLRWALQGHDEAELEVLRHKGIFQHRRGTFRPVEDAIRRAMEARGQHEDLERELLAYLAGRTVLSERDLARALQLAVHHAEHGTLADLLERHAVGSTLIQSVLVSTLRNRRVSAKVKLNSFQALAEHITVVAAEDLLQVHDDLITSADVLERRVAEISFLRAAFLSWHRELPAEAATYLDAVLACEVLPAAAKQQIVHVWAFRAVHARRRPDDLHHAFGLLEQAGVDPPTLRAYRMLFDGVELTYQYRLVQATALVRDSAAAFAACGRQRHVEWVQRYLLALYYSSRQTAEFRALLDQINDQIDRASRDHLRADFRARFFRAVDTWNAGNDEPLAQECAVAPGAPTGGHPLLPGPHLVDCQPVCFRVILDRAHDAAIAGDRVELVADAVHRMMVFIPITISAVCLAQHVWLAGDQQSLARLCAALQSIGTVGEAHALLLRGFEALATDLVDIDDLLGLLDRAWLLCEPLTTPYYVVIAAHLIHGARIAADCFIERVRGQPQLAAMPVRARQVIEAALLALGADNVAGAAPPDELRRVVAAQVHRARRTGALAPAATDAPVEALKQLIDGQWFEEVNVEAFARAHHVSRFVISRRFKHLLGRSPRQYLQETRIHHAKHKLLETNWTVTDIAYECGFADAAQFSRMFKEATGMTPVRYRESSRNVMGSSG